MSLFVLVLWQQHKKWTWESSWPEKQTQTSNSPSHTNVFILTSYCCLFASPSARWLMRWSVMRRLVSKKKDIWILKFSFFHTFSSPPPVPCLKTETADDPDGGKRRRFATTRHRSCDILHCSQTSQSGCWCVKHSDGFSLWERTRSEVQSRSAALWFFFLF